MAGHRKKKMVTRGGGQKGGRSGHADPTRQSTGSAASHEQRLYRLAGHSCRKSTNHEASPCQDPTCLYGMREWEGESAKQVGMSDYGCKLAAKQPRRVVPKSKKDTNNNDDDAAPASATASPAKQQEQHQTDFYIHGLRNCGNTCYFNAVAQCLFHTAHFARQLVSSSDLTDSKAVEELKLHALFGDMLLSNAEVVDPKPTLSALSINSYEQQDAQELLALLLSCAGDVDPRIRRCIDKQFGGVLLYTRTCKECGKETRKAEEFLFLTLQVETTLKQSVQRLLQAEEVPLESGVQCEACKKPVACSSQASMKKLPPTLAVHFLRFQYNKKDFSRTRVNHNVEIPMRMQASVLTDNSDDTTIYHLRAAIHHKGKEATHGHYVAHAWIPDDTFANDGAFADARERTEAAPAGQWMLFDDSTVSVSEVYGQPPKQGDSNGINPTVSSSEVYMLFYVAEEGATPLATAAATADAPSEAAAVGAQSHNKDILRTDQQWGGSCRVVPSDAIQRAVAKGNAARQQLFDEYEAHRMAIEEHLSLWRPLADAVFDTSVRQVKDFANEWLVFVPQDWLDSFGHAHLLLWSHFKKAEEEAAAVAKANSIEQTTHSKDDAVDVDAPPSHVAEATPSDSTNKKATSSSSGQDDEEDTLTRIRRNLERNPRIPKTCPALDVSTLLCPHGKVSPTKKYKLIRQSAWEALVASPFAAMPPPKKQSERASPPPSENPLAKFLSWATTPWQPQPVKDTAAREHFEMPLALQENMCQACINDDANQQQGAKIQKEVSMEMYRKIKHEPPKAIVGANVTAKPSEDELSDATESESEGEDEDGNNNNNNDDVDASPRSKAPKKAPVGYWVSASFADDWKINNVPTGDAARGLQCKHGNLSSHTAKRAMPREAYKFCRMHGVAFSAKFDWLEPVCSECVAEGIYATQTLNALRNEKIQQRKQLNGLIDWERENKKYFHRDLEKYVAKHREKARAALLESVLKNAEEQAQKSARPAQRPKQPQTEASDEAAPPEPKIPPRQRQFHVISAAWIRRWVDWIESPSDLPAEARMEPPPKTIMNDELICEHGGSAIFIDDLRPRPEDNFTPVAAILDDEKDAQSLLEHYDIGLRVMACELDEDRMLDPPTCEACATRLREEQRRQRVEFTDGNIHVTGKLRRSKKRQEACSFTIQGVRHSMTVDALKQMISMNILEKGDQQVAPEALTLYAKGEVLPVPQGTLGDNGICTNEAVKYEVDPDAAIAASLGGFTQPPASSASSNKKPEATFAGTRLSMNAHTHVPPAPTSDLVVSCPACTFDNPMGSKRCEICNTAL